ncbi:hypothetical protein BDW22DRAFT_1476361 [Trametopsis cervina]|nr:hypothetical protein BDW22DRAFT_1476361 [Trametopsis cervina]
MGPSRTPKHRAGPGEASASSSGAHQKKRNVSGKSKHPRAPEDLPALPGVQKIKAALRQTRRLLAKEKLAADVRVATERKQRALETDLANAERARKERTLAQRYHKIKFFERQKVTRKVKQVQRQLESCTEKKEKKKLEKALFELRVDLNYILVSHYPKLKKYISLFPPELRQHTEDGSDAEKGKEKEYEVETAATDEQREEIRKDIRSRMEQGELSAEPEKEDQQTKVSRHKAASVAASKQDGGTHKSGTRPVADIGEDTFFGGDSDEEGGGDEDEEMDSD